MPKTKDAFAFRDFDEEKLLFRIFRVLRELTRRVKEDYDDFDNEEDIPCDDYALERLATMIVEMKTIKESKSRGAFIFSLATDILSFIDRIFRHVKRLSRFSSVLADKIASSDEPNEKWQKQHYRLKSLTLQYANCLASTTLFVKKFMHSVEGFDVKISAIYRQHFAERLKQARLNKKMTQAQVAKKLGLTVGAYQFYETAKREPNITTLIQVSNVLGVTPNWLLGFE